jgi:peptidase E
MTPDADVYLIAGGRDSSGPGRDPLLAAIVANLGVPLPRLAYVGAASSDNRMFFMWVAATFRKAGAGPVRLAALASQRADTARARALLEDSDAVLISGGDVDLGMRVLARTGLIPLLAGLHRQGKPFIGLSAGSIMLARSWVRWADPHDDATAAAFPCLGLAPVLCDTHAETEGWEELKVLLRLSGADSGFGIPSGAALLVRADGSVAAMGRPVRRIALGAELPDLVPD